MDLIIRPSELAYKKAESLIKVIDQTSSFNSATSNIAISKIAKKLYTIKSPVSRYFESPQQINYTYSEGEYDLTAIFKLLKYEAYFLKSVQKKTSLLVKSGLSITSDNDEISKYINDRFKYMHLQTGKSIRNIIKQIGYYLIICSNAYVIKVRDKNCTFASSYIKDGKEMHPIVGLFTAHPACMKPKYKYIKDRSQKSGIRLELDKWVFVNYKGIIKEFDPDDVSHFSLYKEDGMLLGTPEIVPVIDDIRSLRKLEEDIQMLIYRDLFPIIHYKVEDPRVTDHHSGETELDRAKNDMQNSIQDGGIATDARHNIDFVGNQGKSLDVTPYLKYFQERVFTGLGVSAVDLGLGEGASRSTAETLSGQLIDFVKFVQQEISQQFQEQVLNEMMLQSNFNGIFDEENVVNLQFQEIDIEWKIRQENHQADLYSKGVSTIHEVRNKMNKKTISDDQIENETFHGIQSKLALKENQVKETDSQSAADKDLTKSSKTTSNIVKAKDYIQLRDSEESITLQDEFKNVILSLIHKEKTKKKIDVIFATKYLFDNIKSNIASSLKEGYTKTKKDLKITDSSQPQILTNIFSKLDTERNLIVDMISKDNVNINKAAVKIATVNRTEKARAYNLGVYLAAKESNIDKLVIYHDLDNISEDSSQLLGKELDLSSITYNDLPPYRYNQRLKVKPITNS